jgi:hypothetical protein
MPAMAMPSAVAESSSGGRRRRPPASQSARPEAAMPTATLATTISGACVICALACSAVVPM